MSNTYLDNLINDIDKEYTDEYDCDHDGESYFRCSRSRHQILEDYDLFTGNLDDDEYAYVESGLDKLEQREWPNY